jgi:hypothetical protein
VSDCTIEVKYIAAAESVKEGVWIRKFLIELGVFPCQTRICNTPGVTQSPDQGSTLVSYSHYMLDWKVKELKALGSWLR